MDSDQIPRLIYLIVLCTAVAGWFFAQNRQSLGKNMQFAAIWGLIFVGAIAGVGLWQDIRGDLSYSQVSAGEGRVEIPRHRDGHFYATLLLNGTPVRFAVDTGATNIVLSVKDAERAGIDTDALVFLGQAQTANGTVRTARITLERVQFEGITDQNLRAYVNGGDLDGSLLGMDYLNRFSKIEISGGRLILQR